jgi:glycosyltransferase involved in cell wall biosynthesis
VRNVLMIIHYPVYGGPHSQALRLAPVLERQGWHAVVLLSDESGNAAEIMKEEGLDTETISLRRLRGTLDPMEHFRSASSFAREVRTIRRVIEKRAIDIVQISGLVNVQGAVAAWQERLPIVWQLMDTRAPMPVRRLMMPIVVRMSDVVMSTGSTVATLHPGSERLGDRLRVFYMPVDPESFAPALFDRATAREALGYDESDLLLGTIGNLNPQKGHDYLLRAVARARMELDRVKLLVIGSPHVTHRAYEENLHRLATSLGLEIGIDVVFTGGLRDVRPALAAMDLFVLAAVPHSEGAPAAVEEAMMMSRAVVATDVGSLREVVRNGETGLVVPPLDVESMADAIVKVLLDGERRVEMGARGRAHALRRFATADCASIHASAYDFAVRHHRSRRGDG